MERYLEEHIRRDLPKKIIIVSGPRQVGKTSLSKQLVPSFIYLNYDSASDRKMIQNEDWPRNVPLVIFDELHKLKNWNSKIKGIYDTDGLPPGLLITGSARLETARKGGDSMAGRFFTYRLHPLTVREITGTWRTSIFGFTVTLNLTQNGTSFSGSWADSVGRTSNANGSLSAPRKVHMTFSRFIDFWDLNADPAFGAMSGIGNAFGDTYNVTLTRQ